MTADRPIVTFSAGDPPLEDMVRRGIGAEHIDDGVLRVARSVLRQNLDIAYAGDLRGGGFAADLSDDTGKVVLGPRFISFLGWPYEDQLTTTQIANTMGLCRYVRVSPDEDTKGIEPFVEKEGKKQFAETSSFGWAMAKETTKTRQTLFSVLPCEDINKDAIKPRVAQVLFAGKARGFLGMMPGIAEEALCAINAKLALYIVGAFGGAARLLAESLTGSQSSEMFRFETHESDATFARMLAGARDAGCASDPEEKFQRLETALQSVREDFNLLHNGLNEEENRQVMLTSDLGKVVRLISKGLGKLGYR